MNLVTNTQEFTEALDSRLNVMQFPANANLLLCSEPFTSGCLDDLQAVADKAGRSLHLR